MVGYFIITSKIAAKFLLSYNQFFLKNAKQAECLLQKLKYTIINGIFHISVGTVNSPSCLGLKELAAS